MLVCDDAPPSGDGEGVMMMASQLMVLLICIMHLRTASDGTKCMHCLCPMMLPLWHMVHTPFQFEFAPDNYVDGPPVIGLMMSLTLKCAGTASLCLWGCTDTLT